MTSIGCSPGIGRPSPRTRTCRRRQPRQRQRRQVDESACFYLLLGSSHGARQMLRSAPGAAGRTPERSREAGFQEHLVEPFDPDRLKALLEAAMQG